MVRRLGNNNNNHQHKKNQYYEGVRSYSREDLPDLPEGMNPASPEAVKGKSLSEKNGTTSFEIDLPERRISLSGDEDDGDIEVIETGVSHWVPQTVRWKIVTVLLVLAVGFSSFVVRFHSLTGEEDAEGLQPNVRECFQSNEELKRAVDLFLIIQQQPQQQPPDTSNNISATYQEEWKSLTDTYGGSISTDRGVAETRKLPKTWPPCLSQRKRSSDSRAD